jgi:hypothetical protein
MLSLTSPPPQRTAMLKQTVQCHDSSSLVATFLPRILLLSNRPAHNGIYSEESGNGTGSFHQGSALNRVSPPPPSMALQTHGHLIIEDSRSHSRNTVFGRPLLVGGINPNQRILCGNTTISRYRRPCPQQNSQSQQASGQRH